METMRSEAVALALQRRRTPSPYAGEGVTLMTGVRLETTRPVSVAAADDMPVPADVALGTGIFLEHLATRRWGTRDTLIDGADVTCRVMTGAQQGRLVLIRLMSGRAMHLRKRLEHDWGIRVSVAGEPQLDASAFDVVEEQLELPLPVSARGDVFRSPQRDEDAPGSAQLSDVTPDPAEGLSGERETALDFAKRVLRTPESRVETGSRRKAPDAERGPRTPERGRERMGKQSRWKRGERGSVERWERDVRTFLASRHHEARAAGPVLSGYPDGWAPPLPSADERRVLCIYGSHWLFEVTDPARAGYRLVGLVVDGKALVWDLPGYSQRDAETMCINLVDGYLKDEPPRQ